MNKLFLIICVSFSLSLCGCGALMILPIMDKMGELAEKMAKIEAEKRAELRKENHSIEGEILSTEVITKEEEIEVPAGGIHISVNKDKEEKQETKIEKIIKKFFLVKFIDGRDMQFADVSEKPLNKGSYYIIKYNGLKEITSVENKND